MLGIVSIVMAFFQPLAGIIFGIIGLVQNKKEKSVKSKKLNIIGIVLSIAWLIISVGITYYLTTKGLGNLANFPTG